MTMREKLIEAAFRAFRDQDKLGRDWFDLGAADDGKTILDGAYDLGIVIDAILAELREPDEGLTAALVAAVRQQVAWISPDPTSQNPASEVLFVDAGSIDVDEIKVAMIDHIRSGK